MKFVCEKCRTKYSIADEKVRRKVLKIRCKNCSNIIVVREPKEASAESALPPQAETRRGKSALDAAFAGAFGSRPKPKPVADSRSVLRSHGPLAAAPLDAIDSAEQELEEENTVLDARPLVPPAASPSIGSGSMPPLDDEWYLAFDGNQFGPMAFTELCSRVKRGEARSEVGDEVFVWRDGLDDWVEVHNVPELRPYVPPPPPPRGRSGLFAVVDAQRSGSSLQPMPQPPASLQPPPSQTPIPPVTAIPRPPPVTNPQISSAPSPPSIPALPPPAESPSAGPLPATESQGDGVEVMAAMESGLRQLPGAFTGQVVAPSLVPPQSQPAKTPASIKIAAVGGIISTLTGVAILVYFLAFDRPHVQPPPAVSEVPIQHPAPVTPPPEPEKPEEALQFPAIEISRSKTGEKQVAGARTARRHKQPRVPAKQSAAAKEQQRLLALYKKSNTAAEVPAGPTPTRRKQAPKRRLGPNDVTRVQRQNSRALKACYERALKRDRTLANARVDAELSIGESGLVRSVKVTGSDSVDLMTCLQRSIKRWVFPAVGAQTISFPLIFRGS